MGKPKLLECTAYGDAMSFLDNIGASISDYSSLLRTSWTHEIVNSPRIEDLRAHHRVVLSAGLSMPIVKPDKKRSGRNRKAITYTASGNPPPISPEELSLSCAYFFNGAPPEVRDRFTCIWTSVEFSACRSLKTTGHIMTSICHGKCRVLLKLERRMINSQDRLSQSNWRRRVSS